jgi:hypothetical protein
VRASSATLDPYSGEVLMERSIGAMAAVVRALAVPYKFSWQQVKEKRGFCFSKFRNVILIHIYIFVEQGLCLVPTVHLSIVAEAGTGWDSAVTLVHGVVLARDKQEEVGEKM